MLDINWNTFAFSTIYTHIYVLTAHIVKSRTNTFWPSKYGIISRQQRTLCFMLNLHIYDILVGTHTEREIERNSNGTKCAKYSILKAYCHPYGCYEWQHIRRTINLLQHLHNYSLLLLAVFVTRISTRMLSFEIPYGWKFWQYWDKSNDRN